MSSDAWVDAKRGRLIAVHQPSPLTEGKTCESRLLTSSADTSHAMRVMSCYACDDKHKHWTFSGSHLDARDADSSKQEGSHASQDTLRDGGEESPNLQGSPHHAAQAQSLNANWLICCSHKSSTVTLAMLCSRQEHHARAALLACGLQLKLHQLQLI